MNFEQMVKTLLLGKPVKRENWRINTHIKIAKNGDIVDELGYPFTFNKQDYEAKWKIYKPLTLVDESGLMLYGFDIDGNKVQYRVVSDSGDYEIVDVECWAVIAKNISADNLYSTIDELGMERA